MALIAFSFVVFFLLLASGGLLFFYRNATLQRISTATLPLGGRRVTLRSSIQAANFSFGGMVQPLERVLPKSQAEVSIVQQRLIRAGFRKDSAVKTFYGAKVLVPAAFCALAAASGLAQSSPFFAYALALGIGYLAPDFWLGRRIKHRQKRIRLGLPDVLDLLVVCMEAGLSMDMATARTAEELRLAQPELTDEIGIVVLEQRAGRARADAWKQLAERTEVESVRNLASVLVQSEQLGTSIAKTLRVHSDTLRMQRRQLVEEQAAKTTVKLVFPLVFFIFPSLFIVTIGPAVIVMVEAFHKYLTK